MNTETADTLQKLESIFQDTFTGTGYEFSTETTRDDIDEWDSLNHIRLLTAIESEFEFQFDLDEIEDISSVSTIVEIINNKLS